jgi:hypothetical protein
MQGRFLVSIHSIYVGTSFCKNFTDGRIAE